MSETTHDVTDWYPKTVKPATPGWYETSYAGLGIRVMRWFDGNRWLIGPGIESKLCFFGMKGCRDRWRGLRSPA